MRLIDADALLKEDICEHCLNRGTWCENTCTNNGNEETAMRKMIEDATTIDAVPVVRCKDCKHSLENNGLRAFGARYCHRNIYGNDVYEPVFDRDFCSKAVRKEVQE